MIYYMILLGGTCLGAAASMFFKKASGSENLWKLLANPWLWIGGMLYGVSALIDVYILRFLDYSVVLPLTAVTYIWTMLFSHLFLEEKIGRKKLAGVGFIVAGALLVAL